MSIDAMKQWLLAFARAESLLASAKSYHHQEILDAYNRFSATIEAAERQEPVATVRNGKVHWHNGWPEYDTKLYTTPQPAPAGMVLVPDKVTEEMHIAACKVLVRAHGLDGLPQRMLTAMLAAAPKVPK